MQTIQTLAKNWLTFYAADLKASNQMGKYEKAAWKAENSGRYKTAEACEKKMWKADTVSNRFSAKCETIEKNLAKRGLYMIRFHVPTGKYRIGAIHVFNRRSHKLVHTAKV